MQNIQKQTYTTNKKNQKKLQKRLDKIKKLWYNIIKDKKIKEYGLWNIIL